MRLPAIVQDGKDVAETLPRQDVNHAHLYGNSDTTNKKGQHQYLQARVRTNRLVQKQDAHLDLICPKRAFRNSKHTVRNFVLRFGAAQP